MRLKDIDVSKTYRGQQIEVEIDFDLIKDGKHEVVTREAILTVPNARQIIALQECASLRMKGDKEDDETEMRMMSTEVFDKALGWIKITNGKIDFEFISLEDGEAIVALTHKFLGKARGKKKEA